MVFNYTKDDSYLLMKFYDDKIIMISTDNLYWLCDINQETNEFRSCILYRDMSTFILTDILRETVMEFVED